MARHRSAAVALAGCLALGGLPGLGCGLAGAPLSAELAGSRSCRITDGAGGRLAGRGAQRRAQRVTELVEVRRSAVGRGTGVDDAGWMRKVTAILAKPAPLLELGRYEDARKNAELARKQYPEEVYDLLKEYGVDDPLEYEVLNSRNSPLVGRAVDYNYAKHQRHDGVPGA